MNYRYCVPVIWFLLNEIGAVTLALNSSVNFIIYYATGKHFRDEFIRMLVKFWALCNRPLNDIYSYFRFNR